MVYK
jgi:obg-like ATPase 1